MSSFYTLKNIEESWNILLNPSSSPEMRNKADKFLIDFKVKLFSKSEILFYESFFFLKIIKFSEKNIEENKFIYYFHLNKIKFFHRNQKI